MQSYQAFHIQLPLDIHTPLQAALNNAVTLESSNAGADTSNTGILNVAVDVQAVRVAFVGMMRAIIAGTILTMPEFWHLLVAIFCTAQRYLPLCALEIILAGSGFRM